MTAWSLVCLLFSAGILTSASEPRIHTDNSTSWPASVLQPSSHLCVSVCRQSYVPTSHFLCLCTSAAQDDDFSSPYSGVTALSTPGGIKTVYGTPSWGF